MTTADVVVLLLALALFGYELYALGTPKPGDELTGYLRRLRASGFLGALIVGGGVTWFFYHIVLNDGSTAIGWPDAVAVLVGYGLVRYRAAILRVLRRFDPRGWGST